jgi:hypothetical protein
MNAVKPCIGDWVLITGHSMISKAKWHESYPQGIFGRIIDIKPDKKFRGTIEIRAYMKGGRAHLYTNEKQIIINK